MPGDIASKRVLDNPPTASRALSRLWSQRLMRMVIASVTAALVGLWVALTMPYGPATAVQTFIVMGTSLAVGLLAGLLVPKGWVVLLTALAYMTAVEWGRCASGDGWLAKT